MKKLNVSFPEIAFVAGTRGLGGIGIGLLAGNYLKSRQRKKLGLALLAIGILTTIPIAFTANRRYMRYRTIQDLPREHTERYDGHQKEAFLKAFNGAYQKYGHDEERAFEAAHVAARKAGFFPDAALEDFTAATSSPQPRVHP